MYILLYRAHGTHIIIIHNTNTCERVQVVISIVVAVVVVAVVVARIVIYICHFPGDQNRAEDRYEEEAHNPNEEGQYVFQSFSPD